MRSCVLFILGLTVLLGTACDTTGPDAFEQQIVVESYQTAGERLAPVRLSRTTPLDSTYRFADLAVRDATVEVQRLADDGSVAERFLYRADPDSLGFYRPAARGAGRPVPRVQPLTTYRLVADVPDGPTLRATTTVPDTFRVLRVNRDTTAYQAGEQIALRVTRSQTPGRDRAYYVLSTKALEITQENLTPIAREQFEDADDTSLRDLQITSSPVINEESYIQNADGTITIRLPWIAVRFYGPNETRASVLDGNLYDFLRSQSAQQGGGAFSPGAIPSLIEHVEGGTGIFGSRARVATTVVFTRAAPLSDRP
jgi:hypothetical protein